uniref:Uncharacterized protein n=1 Tax=Rhizophora mucronata TaxID=61149 RepID=A0A2P2P346_RHIMU
MISLPIQFLIGLHRAPHSRRRSGKQGDKRDNRHNYVATNNNNGLGFLD